MKTAISILILLALSSMPGQGNRRVVLPAHQGPITDLAIVGDSFLSCSHRGVLKEKLDGSLRQFPSPPFRIVSIAPLSSGLLVAGGEPGESGKYAILKLDTGFTSPPREIAEDLVYSIAVSEGTGFFALADGRVLGIDLENFSNSAALHHRHTAPARSVRVSPDGRFLASGGMDRLVIVSDLERKSDRADIQDHTGAVDCLTFSPDSARVASGARDGKIRVHAVPGGKLIRTYSGLIGEICTIAWGGEPERLLAGTTTGRIYQLDLSNDSSRVIEERAADIRIPPLMFGPDGSAITAGTRNIKPVP